MVHKDITFFGNIKLRNNKFIEINKNHKRLNFISKLSIIQFVWSIFYSYNSYLSFYSYLCDVFKPFLLLESANTRPNVSLLIAETSNKLNLLTQTLSEILSTFLNNI